METFRYPRRFKVMTVVSGVVFPRRLQHRRRPRRRLSGRVEEGPVRRHRGHPREGPQGNPGRRGEHRRHGDRRRLADGDDAL